MRRSPASAAGLLALLLVGARPAAGDWVGERLCAAGLAQGGEFGSAVAVGDDGTIAVGDHRHDVVALFRRSPEGRCEQHATVRGRAGEGFGFDLALDGDRLLIGAPQSGGTGAVYLYDLSTGGLEPVTVPQAQRGDEVGSAVAMDGGTLAIGARGADDRRGRVYAGSPGALTTIPIPGLAPRAELGQSVALYGSTLVVGAPFPYRGSGSPGAAWVVDLDSGSVFPLTPSGRLEPEAAYGYAVAVDGNRIVVGAPLADRLHRDAGVVFEFRREGTQWSQGPDLNLPGNAGDQLGVAIAVDGEMAVVGARYAASTRGEAYVVDLRNSSFQSLAQGQGIDVPAGAQFGFSVAARGGTVVVGAFRERGIGAAYRFEAAVTVAFAGSSSAVLESAGTAPLQVIVRGSASRLSAPVTVDLAILDGTATRNVDFSFDEGPYVIPAGTRTGEPYTLAEARIRPNAPAEEPETFQVQLSARLPAVTGDPDVHEVTIQESLLVISGGPLQTSEAGGSAPLEVRLAVRPEAKVTVSFRTSDPSEGIVAPTQLTFTSETWSSGQTVQVTGQDDALCDGDQTYEIRVTTTSADSRYAGLSRSIPAENADDDRACLSAVKEVCTDGGGTVVYTIVLTNSASSVLDAPAELLDLLPPEVSVVTASADKGVATADPIANSVRWTGLVPGGSAVTITIVTALDELPGLGVTNQAEVTYDRDGRGTLQTVRTNEAVLGEDDMCLSLFEPDFR